MLYTYEVWYLKENNEPIRMDITTRFEEVEKFPCPPHFIKVLDNKSTSMAPKKVLFTTEDVEDWRNTLERTFAWKPKEKPKDPFVFVRSIMNPTPRVNTTTPVVNTGIANTPVKPTHYTEFVDEYQWIDVMSRIPRYRDPEKFKAALELQIRKYLDRNGRKDDELQELKKGLFYYMYLVMYIKNNEKPILAKDIHSIMENFK